MCLSYYLYLHLYLSAWQAVCLSVCLSMFLSAYQSICYLSSFFLSFVLSSFFPSFLLSMCSLFSSFCGSIISHPSVDVHLYLLHFVAESYLDLSIYLDPYNHPSIPPYLPIYIYIHVYRSYTVYAYANVCKYTYVYGYIYIFAFVNIIYSIYIYTNYTTYVCVCEAIPMHTLHPMSSLIKLLSDQPSKAANAQPFFLRPKRNYGYNVISRPSQHLGALL